MEQGRQWVEKNQRTVYRALSTQEQVAADVSAVPIIQLAQACCAASQKAATAALRCWACEDERGGLLDLRAEVDYDAGHVIGATSLPWGDEGEVLVARAHELPPRGAALALLAQHPNTLEAAAAHLTKSGYKIYFCIGMPDAPVAWDEVLAAAGLQLSAPGDRSSCRLWQASPCLQAALPFVESRLRAAAAASRATLEPEPQPGCAPEATQTQPRWVALDLGCGSGRDCVWLAQQQQQQQQNSWSVVGVDHLPKMLQRFELLVTHARPAVAWGGYSVDAGNSDIFSSCGSASDGCCAAIQSNVERWVPSSSDHDEMGGLKFANVSLIHISHYLHRPLLGWIRDHSSLVAVGGSVVRARSRATDQPIHPRLTHSVVRIIIFRCNWCDMHGMGACRSCIPLCAVVSSLAGRRSRSFSWRLANCVGCLKVQRSNVGTPYAVVG